MKRMFRVITTVVLAVALILSLGACGQGKLGANEGSSSNAATAESAVSAAASTATETSTTTETDQKVVKIGIVQIVEHPSLNTIRESFIAQLAEKGYKDGENINIDYQNAQGDQTNLNTIVQKFVADKSDLIVAIATPSAQAAANATSDIPVLFSACTDPVGSGLVASLDKPGKNVTGTSDAVSAEKIMELAKRITPDIKKIGALYNSSETNSISVVNNLKEYAKNNGMEVIEGTVTNSSEVQQVTQSLAGQVDAIFSPIDNTIAAAMPVVAQVANSAKKPVYVGADSMVKDGGLATYGVNYTTLGQETANMAVEILNGKKPGDMPVKIMSDVQIYVNKDTAKAIGITIPDDVLKEAAQVFGE
ncbi:MAG TPA: ABC transporter substrate-binding protein [Clostridia bacterium]|nr:ABC transporter substrate-binding protein [Clostridia bacterium]